MSNAWDGQQHSVGDKGDAAPGRPTASAAQTQKLPELPASHREALQRIVSDWIGEGFTTPPYTDEQYDIFEWLGLANNDPHSYDTRRPA